ncbi:MAG TPA: hypothetical protein VJL78_07635, partial [Candidatus Nitrosocosmicus sp.]|nr:hypothetical protein [Candidatus Nitrosocosmicus sp.]
MLKKKKKKDAKIRNALTKRIVITDYCDIHLRGFRGCNIILNLDSSVMSFHYKIWYSQNIMR